MKARVKSMGLDPSPGFKIGDEYDVVGTHYMEDELYMFAIEHPSYGYLQCLRVGDAHLNGGEWEIINDS